ncbi:hypothetical protein AB0O76_33925 [Streptomyces sp. NPDC086554]|uniref:hypothetical protein n=1 Tax=Streptomyces sp. NPDC086554 TaxID=3154864 RepID=UPI00342D2846
MVRASNTGSRRREQRNRQIFVDGSGRRRRLLRYAALLVACACAGYLLLLATALTGVLRQHAGAAPGAVEPAPATGVAVTATSGGIST